MAIVGQNTILNQYVPTFVINSVLDGQVLVYDAIKKAFINANQGARSLRLGELVNVSASADSALDGQSLIYNSSTLLWENRVANFIGLGDTAKPSVANGYVKWNATGSQLVYSTTIPASTITGLAAVAISGSYTDLTGLTHTQVSFGSITNSPTGSPNLTWDDTAHALSATTFIGNLTGAASLNVLKSGDTMTGYLILNADPTNALGAVTKQYVDNIATGINVHAACETSTTPTGNLPAATYNNGTGGVGATLTANANGSINAINAGAGVGGYNTLVVGARVLVKDQVTQIQNGIYVVTSLGAPDVPGPGAPWVLTRASDFDGSPTSEVEAGDLTYVQEGTIGGSQWVQTSIGTGHNVSPAYDYVIVGTDNIIFGQFAGAGSYTSGIGINIASNVISNTGVLSLVAGTNIAVSGSTGNITISVTGTVPSATNLAGGTAGGIPYQTGVGATGITAAGVAGQILTSNGSSAPTWGGTKTALPIACSDEITALTVGTAKVTFRMPYAMTLTAVRASLTTAQTSGNIFTVNIKQSGTSILSTLITIDNTEKTSTTAVTLPVISIASLADDAEMTIDISQIGDGTAKGLKVYLIGTV